MCDLYPDYFLSINSHFRHSSSEYFPKYAIGFVCTLCFFLVGMLMCLLSFINLFFNLNFKLVSWRFCGHLHLRGNFWVKWISYKLCYHQSSLQILTLVLQIKGLLYRNKRLIIFLLTPGRIYFHVLGIKSIKTHLVTLLFSCNLVGDLKTASTFQRWFHTPVLSFICHLSF